MLKLMTDAVAWMWAKLTVMADGFGQLRIANFLTRLLAPVTISRYRAATKKFENWLETNELSWHDKNEETQDWILAEFVLEQVDEGDESPQQVRDVVSAMQKRFPRRKYLTAWQVVRGWSQLRPPCRAPPIPEDLAMAVVVLSELSDKSAFSLASLLCFVGLLRISESLKMLRSDMVLGESTLILLLGRTKTGQHQRVVISNAAVVNYVKCWLTNHPGQNGERLCPISYSTFSKWLQKFCRALGVASFKFRSHSFRRGGATTMFTRGQPLTTIMHHGRWQSETSCRLYIQHGEADLLNIQRSAIARQARISALAQLGAQVFEFKK